MHNRLHTTSWDVGTSPRKASREKAVTKKALRKHILLQSALSAPRPLWNRVCWHWWLAGYLFYSCYLKSWWNKLHGDIKWSRSEFCTVCRAPCAHETDSPDSEESALARKTRSALGCFGWSMASLWRVRSLTCIEDRTSSLHSLIASEAGSA